MPTAAAASAAIDKWPMFVSTGMQQAFRVVAEQPRDQSFYPQQPHEARRVIDTGTLAIDAMPIGVLMARCSSFSNCNDEVGPQQARRSLVFQRAGYCSAN